MTAPIIIAGGNGMAGCYLIRQLAEAGLRADVISRRPLDLPPGFTQLPIDLSRAGWTVPDGAIVISFLPLWLLSDFLPRFAGARAVIATGSTSRFSKQSSGDDSERRVAALLQAAEENLHAWARRSGADLTILRPTLIYDCRTDKNITRMARFIRRWQVLPLAAPASGLRQPIHADDVARAAFKCIGNPAAAGRDMNIAGSEILSYREMAVRIFAALGMKPRFLILPTDLLQKAFRMATLLRLTKRADFTASTFQRMNEDLIFDNREGLEILDYRPRPFAPDFSEKA